MFQSLVFILLLLLFIGLLIFFACSRTGKSYDCNDTLGGIAIVCICVMVCVNCIHFYIVADRNLTADERLAEKLRLYEDLQVQVNNFTDEQTLASVMERVEQYNKDVAYGKTAAHSPWNAWSFPEKIYDNLEFINMPEG